jgi:hypothetical protein
MLQARRTLQTTEPKPGTCCECPARSRKLGFLEVSNTFVVDILALVPLLDKFFITQQSISINASLLIAN